MHSPLGAVHPREFYKPYSVAGIHGGVNAWKLPNQNYIYMYTYLAKEFNRFSH